jgi:hypothetical protein
MAVRGRSHHGSVRKQDYYRALTLADIKDAADALHGIEVRALQNSKRHRGAASTGPPDRRASATGRADSARVRRHIHHSPKTTLNHRLTTT